MSRHSPQTTTYKDLLKWVAKHLAKDRQRHSAAPGYGVDNLNALSHDVACGEKLERMLKKCEPGRQADMLELFNRTR